MRADRHGDELLVHKVKHAKMYVGILKCLFKGKKKKKPPHQEADTFAFNNLKCGDYLSLKTRGKVNYDKSVILARCQMIVEGHPQIWGGGGDYMLLKCA